VAATTFGASLRQTKGDYPQARTLPGGVVQATRYDRRELELTGRLAPSAISTYVARIGIGRSEYELTPERNYSGVTGELGWNWRPTGKLRFDTRLVREPGQDSYFTHAEDNPNETVQTSRISTRVQLRADYAATAKISLNTALRYAHRSLTRNQPAASELDALKGTDRTVFLTVGAVWTPTRTSRIGCDLSREQRRGDASLSSDYNANIVGCHGQLTLQF